MMGNKTEKDKQMKTPGLPEVMKHELCGLTVASMLGNFFQNFPKSSSSISREWIAPATATYMLGKLVETFANNDTSTCEARAIQVSVMVMADVVIVLMLIHRHLTHS